ncbi:Polyadenylation and cleavage factor 11 [Trichuris trichiura]|uniref:Polyadenylation and cleavage factor 11 n=1 Tax=Trichuris trichiura TaxID=36087 RepID=A0A077ZF70_TRITR|nr:Polyadenylation and cleavage factor 11 [Trichuris trichiura]
MALTEEDVIADYRSSLLDLQFNSKPHINMLTMLAEESQQFAPQIVEVIERHFVLLSVPPSQKLPVLYLIDSIVKNCPESPYKDLFAKNLINTFVHVFDKVDEKTRQSLFKLRQTWLDIFPASRLYRIDIKVHEIDPAWPLQEPSQLRAAQNTNAIVKNVHFNPRFIEQFEKVSSTETDRYFRSLQMFFFQQDVHCQRRSRFDVYPENMQENQVPPSFTPYREELPADQKMDVVLPEVHDPRLKAKRPFVNTYYSVLPNEVKPPLIGHATTAGSSAGIAPSSSASVLDTTMLSRKATTVEIVSDDSSSTVPINNRLYVDGLAYEVRFIDEVAVIERNGLPHRIYFVGPPHDVVIDGIPHPLSFSDPRQIIIDGQSHTIRFGAPSRELYVGNFPLRASFGGPPIFVNVNGVKHKIQLCGPPPEVKIDPEPAYELIRFMSLASESSRRAALLTPKQPVANQRTAAAAARYKSVIDSLHQHKIQCSTCGMRFPVDDNVKYAKHLDWHFKMNRREKSARGAVSRPWFLALEVRAHKCHLLFQFCAVCEETFEQFFDQDEDAWKLRNATVVNGKTYHPLCYQDFAPAGVETPTVSLPLSV